MPFTTREFEAQWEPLLTVERGNQHLRVMHNAARQSGPVVLMLHGMEETWQGWLPMAERLMDDFRLMLVDLPWRAQNDYAWSETLPPSHWLATAIEALPQPPGVLIGHSFGSNTTLEYLCRDDAIEPQAVVLMSPVYRGSPKEITWGLFRESMENFHCIIAEGLQAQGKGHVVDDEIFERMVTSIVDRVGPNGFVNLFRLFGHSPFLELTKISSPTLVIGGRFDPTTTATGVCTLAESLPSGNAVLLDQFNHFCQIAQVEKVTELTVAHLLANLPRR